MDYLSGDEAQDRSLSSELQSSFYPLTGDDPKNRPLNDFFVIPVESRYDRYHHLVLDTFKDRAFLNNPNSSTPTIRVGVDGGGTTSINDLSSGNYDPPVAAIGIMSADNTDYKKNPIPADVVKGYTQVDLYRAMSRQYTGTNKKLLELQNALSRSKTEITSDAKHLSDYPTSRDYFFTLSHMYEPYDFIDLVRIYDLFRIAKQPQSIGATGVCKKYKHSFMVWGSELSYEAMRYIDVVYEYAWADLPDQVFDLFRAVVFAHATGTRQLAAKLAFASTDEYTVETAFQRLSNFIPEFEKRLDGKTLVKILYATGETTEKEFSLTDTEKARFKQILQEVKSYIDIQRYELAAKGYVLITPEAPYTPSPNELDPSENVNMVVDLVKSEKAGEPVFIDISANQNNAYNSTDHTVIDNRIPLVAWQKAPEVMIKWGRTNVTEEGFALPPTAPPAKRGSIAPYIVGGLAAALVIKELKG